MATELFRTNLIETYRETREPDLALSAKFTVRPGNISDTEKVAIDIEREDEEVSPVVTALEGPTLNTLNQFTTKEFTPPTISEGMPFDVGSLLKRLPGQNAYEAADASFQAAMVVQLLKGMRALERKISRHREWQASQILQTGILSLTDENGNLAYQIDFKPKATHLVTVGTAWSDIAAPAIGDIESLSDVIRTDGLRDVDELWMGSDAFNEFIINTGVQQHYDNRRMTMGVIEPRDLGSGAKLQGTLHIGNYQYQIITYNGRGILPAAGSKTKFLDAGKVIFLSSDTRLDTVFGGIPRVVPVDPRLAGFLPDRIAVPGAIDLAPNVYATPNGKQTILELESRPLLIPTNIDGFGCLTT